RHIMPSPNLLTVLAKYAAPVGIAAALWTAPGANGQQPDADLLAKIQKIRAIDNHAHTPTVLRSGETDDGYDALPCEPLEPTDATLTSRPYNPAFLEAWKKLFGYKYEDRSPEHVKELIAAKEKLRAEKADAYSAWVLDQLGIETQFANRVAMGRGLVAPR